jgi:hypothetical protein
MLKEDEKSWLKDRYAGLVPSAAGVTGYVEFQAGYNDQTGDFQIFHGEDSTAYPGLILSGRFDISIKERTDKSLSALPAVCVEGVELIPNRHFSRKDNTACLCSPFIENEYLEPEFRFPIFLEQLVIPFLYGQLFYSRESRWPWMDYAHGSTGLLESYVHTNDRNILQRRIGQLGQDRAAWSRISKAIRQKFQIKDGAPCFCPKRHQIKKCHPNALRGIRQLREDVRALGIRVS